MARRNPYELNYARLEELICRPLHELSLEEYFRLVADHDCFMDLVIEVVDRCPETGALIVSLAHYFEQHGDLCQDPEMTVRVFPPGSTVFRNMVPSTDPRHGRLEALTFQQAIPSVYQEVYPEPGRYYPKLKRDLNGFLTTWLRNLKDQGHRPGEEEDTSC